MINVNFFIKENGILSGFNIKGHAEQSHSEKNIVCAAVSSAAYMTANTITEILKSNAEISVDQSGQMAVVISEKDYNRCQDILLGFKLHMIALEEQYPHNIIVNYTEV